MSPLLEARALTKRYGAFTALEDVSLAVGAGEFVAIVGPNGAGKTTLVNLLTGLFTPTSGEVHFKGQDVSGIGPVRLAGLGMARGFQLVHVFPDLTVAETLSVAAFSRLGRGWRLLRSASGDGEVRAGVEQVAAAFGLTARLQSRARELAQGEKKLLDVASAFALAPEVILLDEPTSGVATSDKHALMQTLVKAARETGVKAVVLIEHDMDLVATYAERIIGLHAGRVLADLPKAEFFANAAVVATVIGQPPKGFH
jgi:branched-chain amino acid transport system ATP-binding protein